MDLSKNIKAIRERVRLTQSEVSDKLGVSQSNYAYLESRGDKLTIEQLKSIAGALGVGVGELLGGGAKVEGNESLIQKNEELRKNWERESEYTQTLVKRNLELERQLSKHENVLITMFKRAVLTSAVKLKMIDNKEFTPFTFRYHMNDSRINYREIYEDSLRNSIFNLAIRYDLFGNSEPLKSIIKDLQEYQDINEFEEIDSEQ